MSRTDEEIKRDIVEQLYWDSRVDASKVSVKVREGTVSLSGMVQTRLAVRAAQGDAWIIDGVTAVHNLLEVDHGTPKSPDEEIEATVEKIFNWAPEIDALNAGAQVSGGRVELEGTVTTFWEKQRIGELISNISGVVGVDNKLSVVPTENITDEAVAEDIMSALDRNSSIDPTLVDVKVEDGTVTLSGDVPTWNDRRTAYDAALFTDGVVNIHDDLRVRPVRR
jgi:osmotically-inducible protein OsmY